MSFRKISNKEYEIQIDGRTRTIFVPFGKTEMIFREFVSSGGVIDPTTGEVQNDILSLISSFGNVGNVLLTEFDETGKLVKEGNCFNLASEELVDLFQLATSVIENFIKTLTQMKEASTTQNQQSESERNPQLTKDSQ
jgi:hypothetical protein